MASPSSSQHIISMTSGRLETRSSRGHRGSIDSISTTSTTRILCDNDEANCDELDALLAKAHSNVFAKHLSDALYVAPRKDKLGRHVVVVLAKWLQFEDSEDEEQAVLYLLKMLDPLTRSQEGYVVVYCHAVAGDSPSYALMRKVYALLTYRFKKQLKALYVVHPTMWTRLTCWYLSTFILSSSVRRKIVNVYALTDLSQWFELSHLELPMFVKEHDMRLHGPTYFKL